jgi:NAD-dependent deacetylase sirtuin 4
MFGDNVPEERAESTKEAARNCDALLVVGSALMTMSAFRLARLAHEANAPIAAITIGETRADSILSLKINARCGEVSTFISYLFFVMHHMTHCISPLL